MAEIVSDIDFRCKFRERHQREKLKDHTFFLALKNKNKRTKMADITESNLKGRL